jgi:hypothetical protein
MDAQLVTGTGQWLLVGAPGAALYLWSPSRRNSVDVPASMKRLGVRSGHVWAAEARPWRVGSPGGGSTMDSQLAAGAETGQSVGSPGRGSLMGSQQAQKRAGGVGRPGGDSLMDSQLATKKRRGAGSPGLGSSSGAQLATKNGPTVLRGPAPGLPTPAARFCSQLRAQ